MKISKLELERFINAYKTYLKDMIKDGAVE